MAFSVNVTVQGYHIYNNIWTAVVKEELSAKKRKQFDPFSVAVMRGGMVMS